VGVLVLKGAGAELARYQVGAVGRLGPSKLVKVITCLLSVVYGICEICEKML
jgi:hypothetical protein